MFEINKQVREANKSTIKNFLIANKKCVYTKNISYTFLDSKQ